jgi:sodium-dependent dicarboxylate transporter 2/3/5
MKRGLWLAPIISIVLYLVPIPLTWQGHRMLGILGLATTLWITEAIPLPITALLVVVLIIILGIGNVAAVIAAFADPLLFLFIGSFIIAEAMQIYRLERRFAHAILRSSWVRASGGRLIFVYSGIAFFISMWISNTATTAMMFPIGLSLVRSFDDKEQGIVAPLILLMTSFAASIGGMATPVGTPPNLIGIGMIRELSHQSVNFAQWVKFALPISFLVFVSIFFAMRYFHLHQVLQDPVQELEETTSDDTIRRGQRNVTIAFAVTVFLWLLPTIAVFAGGDPKWWQERLPEAIAAIIGAILLFLLPVNWKKREFTISWKQAENINWGIILLFGGGIVLGKYLFSTGVAKYLGDTLSAIYPFHSEFAFVLLFTLIAVFVSEFTSNTASANLVLPICIAVSQSASVDPLKPALAATLASSLGFMLPISTAPNAIVFGSGLIPLKVMIRYGIVLDVIGAVVVALGVYFLV